jgi:zinc transporter 1/2/3
MSSCPEVRTFRRQWSAGGVKGYLLSPTSAVSNFVDRPIVSILDADCQLGLSWTEIPTELLRAELQRRQDDGTKPACSSGKLGEYNTAAHVAALVLILALSTIACAFPLISRRASKRAGPNKIVFYSQHFGTGVLTATAFVHLLPTAFTSLTDPCLPWIWNEGYRPMAGVIAMTSALVVVGIEMFLRTRGVGGHAHSHGESWEPVAAAEMEMNGRTRPIELPQRSKRLGRRDRPTDLDVSGDSTQGLMAGASPLPESTPTENGHKKYDPIGHDNDDNDSDLDLDELEAQDNIPHDIENPPTTETSAEEQKRLLLQCLLLEAGILFHSIFIGMAISVATGPPFLIFLIAISFHQSFEGLALGSRIAAISFPRRSPKPWLMVLAYGTTTPIGQAIGLGVHRLYDPHSEAGLLMVGVMNAVSSGLLLFAGLVQLLAEDFLSDKSYTVLKGRQRWHAFGSVIAGAALMTLVGAWA